MSPRQTPSPSPAGSPAAEGATPETIEVPLLNGETIEVPREPETFVGRDGETYDVDDPAGPPVDDPEPDELEPGVPVYDERGNVRPHGTKGARPMTYEERVEIAKQTGAHPTEETEQP